MSRLHLIIPMAGAGSRFSDSGWNVPKPLIDLHGKPFFYWSVMPVKNSVPLHDITFAVLKKHVDTFAIDRIIMDYFPDARIIVIPEVLPGPVFTCLVACRGIDDDLPVMFNDCDHMFSSAEAFRALREGFGGDGGLLTFESSLPQFSYVRFDSAGKITGTVEKQPVSSHAICGAYLFGSCRTFRDLAAEYVKNCPYSECFMSGLYNVMCRRNMRVSVFRTDFNIDFGTPEQYELAKNLTEDFSNVLQRA